MAFNRSIAAPPADAGAVLLPLAPAWRNRNHVQTLAVAALAALALVSVVAAAEAGSQKTESLAAAGQVESSPEEIAKIRENLAEILTGVPTAIA